MGSVGFQKSLGEDFVRTGHTFNGKGWLYLSPLVAGARSGNPLSGSKWALDSNARKSPALAASIPAPPPPGN